MTDRRHSVLSYLRAHAPCSYTDVQERCGLPGIESSDAFADLAERGVVVMLPYRNGEQQLWAEAPRQRSLFG